MSYTVTLIPGDGIGPEVSAAMRRVIEATGVPIEWDVQEAGEQVIEQYGTPLPDHVLESIRRNRVGIKGPITTPVGKGFRSVNVAIRKALDLYANVRPAVGARRRLTVRGRRPRGGAREHRGDVCGDRARGDPRRGPRRYASSPGGPRSGWCAMRSNTPGRTAASR